MTDISVKFEVFGFTEMNSDTLKRAPLRGGVWLERDDMYT
jgi:hypothetical protein